MKEQIKAFCGETRWELMEDFAISYGAEHRPTADFWKAFAEWQTDKLLKARQELERVRAFAYTVIFTSDQSKQWQAERRKQLEGLTNNQQRDDNPRI